MYEFNYSPPDQYLIITKGTEFLFLSSEIELSTYTSIFIFLVHVPELNYCCKRQTEKLFVLHAQMHPFSERFSLIMVLSSGQ